MTKSDIIHAAFRVWGQELYRTTSLAQLARELGVSKPALYRHFKNKQALLDAMYTTFFDEYAAFIKPQYDKAISTSDDTERYFIIMRSIVEYYLRYKDAFIFSFIQVYGQQDMENVVYQLVQRGIDMRSFLPLESPESVYPSMIQLIIGELTFAVGYFYRPDRNFSNILSEKTVYEVISSVEESITCGLGLYKRIIDVLDYEKLEKLLFNGDSTGRYEQIEDGNLLKAVASVVAEAGPWNVSMDMVARRSGLSKSSLYSHFKSKQDMLRQLFMTEFERIVSCAEAGAKQSDVPEERLYLIILAVADYLRSRPEILIAIDWLRIRRLDLGLTLPSRIFFVFSNIGIASPKGTGITEQTGHMILFLITNTLMHRPEGMAFSDLSNLSIRRLFKFIVLGIKGFNE